MSDLSGENTSKSPETNPTLVAIPQTVSHHAPPTENPSLQITSHKLNGQNYLPWSRSVTMFVRGRGKYGYLSGTTTALPKLDPSYPTWEAENSMMMAWLINSMEPNIGRLYLFLPTAKAIWEKPYGKLLPKLILMLVKWECAADSKLYSKMLEQERIFEFLIGLNRDLDDVQG
ncbi:hypothetical protein Patl1_15288 [Pistacia atlantica]|uniref:Uncharacterized protein n=1 Tax=Pistacia atlantica TaxID=434234 RepID=A0ACC1B8A0_9ROSI|nr:hypothetical protein Patl1_15288 [Pistacia atlantica]